MTWWHSLSPQAPASLVLLSRCPAFSLLANIPSATTRRQFMVLYWVDWGKPVGSRINFWGRCTPSLAKLRQPSSPVACNSEKGRNRVADVVPIRFELETQSCCCCCCCCFNSGPAVDFMHRLVSSILPSVWGIKFMGLSQKVQHTRGSGSTSDQITTHSNALGIL